MGKTIATLVAGLILFSSGTAFCDGNDIDGNDLLSRCNDAMAIVTANKNEWDSTTFTKMAVDGGDLSRSVGGSDKSQQDL